MVVGAFPLAKLGFLAIRQIAKPIAMRLKQQAKNSNLVRRYIVIPPAQWYHRIETNAKMIIMGLGRPVKVEPLSEAMAVELGSDMLSEMFIFAIGATILVYEYNRSAESAERKERELQDRLLTMEHKIEELGIVSERQKAQIKHLENNLAYYTSPVARLKSLLPGRSNSVPELPSEPEPSVPVKEEQSQAAPVTPTEERHVSMFVVDA